MSMVPPSKPSSLERLKWKVSRELDGLVLDSFEELKERFPADKVFGEVYLKTQGNPVSHYEESFDRYSKNYKGHNWGVDVAYGCPKCEKIIIGPPRIKDENSIGIAPLAGREGYDFYCGNCHAHLGEHTEGQS